ncbi:MAG TPA: ABC transporter permease [Burkholderiales bacterium]|nr:ABC transporter permease [Burkholderiales bacterium]
MNRGKWLISGPPLLYLVVFFVIPTLIMVIASFRYAGEYGGLAPILLHGARGAHLNLTLESYQEYFSDFIYTRLFVKTLVYALITTFFCLLFAYPLALMIARSQKKNRDLLVLLVILPFWSNFLIRIYAWMIILGPQSAFTVALNGFLGLFGMDPVRLLFTPFAVVVCLIYVQLPFMVLPLYANLEKHDPALLDAAQDLGANGWQRFWRVTFPLSLPGIYAGVALVFVPVLGIFAVPDILGGTKGIMIGNLIKQEFLEARDWPFGSALSIILTLGAMAIVGGAALFARRRNV